MCVCVFCVFCVCDGVYKRAFGANRKIMSRTEEPEKAGTCARNRRALQQLALNVHVKYSC